MQERRRGGLDLNAAACLLLAGSVLLAGATLSWHHPAMPGTVLLTFLACGVLTALLPGLWLFVVPAALPALSFAPWTGWIAFEEFDLLLGAVVAGGYARIAVDRWTQREAPSATRSGWGFVGLASVFGVLGVVALAHGGSARWDPVPIWFQSYTDPLNGWRVFKPLLHAALLWPLLHREISRDADIAMRRLASGMLVGLTVVTLAVVWERLAYTGLGDFSTRYRTIALFWEMHVGGAAIDVYLALATPFVGWALWTTRSPLRWSLAAALALLTCYACLTTFSRGVYGAVAGSLVLLALLLRGWRLPRIRWRVVGGWALAVALAMEVAAVLGLGSFMRERMAASDRDLSGRLQHWRNGVDLLRSPADWVLGIGLGRLPAAYAGAVPDRPFPGDVRWVAPGPAPSSGSVRVSGPARPLDAHGLMTLTQRVALHPVPAHDVAFDVRTRVQADIVFQLCEMHLLYPRQCQSAWARVPPGGSDWRRLVVRLHGPLLDGGAAWAPRLGVFSIAVVNDGGYAELDRLSLVGPDRVELLRNRDFSEGLARWYPAAQGYYVPWHIDNLYLELLIERGVLALLAFVSCAVWALRRLVGAKANGSAIAPFLAASLCGGLCVGLVSSAMDVPRVAFLMLLLLLCAVEVADARHRDDARRASGGPTRA